MNSRGRILVADDDSNLRLTLLDALENAGYEAKGAADGEAALAVTAGEFDLILLDLALPGCDGFTVCRRLRTRGLQTPVLILSASGRTSDKIQSLRLGADDYLVKPFDPGELLARIEAILRRVAARPAPPMSSYRFGGVSIDFLRGRVARHGSPLNLSLKELHLLRCLIEHRGETLSREALLHEVWDYRSTGTRTVDMHVATLRQKIEEDPQQPRYIRTVRGEGYQFDDAAPV